MSSGKINNDDFENIILQRCGRPRSEVYCGPSFGVDVSVVNLPGGLAMALTSDPLSLIPSLGLQESAWLSVHLMANDMGTTGFAPMYAQMVLNLPTSLSQHDFNTYWGFVHQYCNDIGVAITGGHTGSIEGQNSTIAGGGTMILTAPAKDILLSRNAEEGNAIIVTKECAISSSAILAMSFPQTVSNKLGKEMYQKGCALFYQTTSLTDALVAAGTDEKYDQITAMHDVTEGGVLGAVYEMAIASGNGVCINNEHIPVSETGRQLCGLFGIDPRYCIGAGSTIIAAKKQYADVVVQRLKDNNINAAIIGEFTNRQQGYTLVDNGIVANLPYYPIDAYWSAFFTAYKNGWK